KAPLAVSEGDVQSVAFSPDGKTLAAGYAGGSSGVVLWDVATRTRWGESPLAVPAGDVRSVAFSPDGKTLAAGCCLRRFLVKFGSIPSGEGGVVLWDVAIRSQLVKAPLAVSEGDVRSVAFSPDGKTLAAGYAGGSSGVVLWDVATRSQLVKAPLAVSEGDVQSVAFSPDGKTLAAGYAGGSSGVVLWDVATRTRWGESPLAVPAGDVRSVAFSPDGKTLAAGCCLRRFLVKFGSVPSGEGGVVLWDVAIRSQLVKAPLAVSEGDVRSVAFSPDGKTLAAGYAGGSSGVVLWDVATRSELVKAPLAVPAGNVRSVAFSPDGKTLAAGYAGGSSGVVLWDVATRSQLVKAPLAVSEGDVQSVAFSPDGKTLAAGYSLWLFIRTFAIHVEEAGRVPGSLKRLVFSGDCEVTKIRRSEPNLEVGVMLWDMATRFRLVKAPLAVPAGDVWSVAFSPDGKTLAAGYSSGGGKGAGVVLWDVATRSQ